MDIRAATQVFNSAQVAVKFDHQTTKQNKEFNLMNDNLKAWADELEVDEFPSCIFCGKEARFNSRTQADLWCYLCEECFIKYGRGLDPTDGQILVLKPKEDKDADL